MAKNTIMKKHFFLLLLFLPGLFSCKKDNNPPSEKDYPKVVVFNYNGEPVTYNVIKKIYYKDSKGISLSSPVTKLWLDRNLGAGRAAMVKNDTLASGDLFQWGRLADGYQKRNSETTDTASVNINPGHNKFIVNTANSDWLVAWNDSLWNDQHNTNCPCPNGLRVPTVEELGMEMYSWGSLTMDGAYSSTLKWVPGGDRDGAGHIYYSTYWAFIWSSTPESNGEAGSLAIIGGSTAEINGSPRSFGLSVRCIKDF